MGNYKLIGIDLAKKKFHFAAMDKDGKIILKKKINRQDFFEQLSNLFPNLETFAFEACSGCHYTAQKLQTLGHTVILLKPKDVKAYAKSRQKNDINDAIAICEAACNPNIMRVNVKDRAEQEIAYLHKARQNTIQQRVQRSNSLMTSMVEFGYVPNCKKAEFARGYLVYLEEAYKEGFLPKAVYEQMLIDGQEIEQLLKRERQLDKAIEVQNRKSPKAKILQTIPGIGPINASILSIKPVELYETAKDFAASLGLVPKQHTTGGRIVLGSITKQGDRYARTILIQGGRAIVMRYSKDNPPKEPIYELVARLKKAGKPFNVICVAVANKLARIAYGCMLQHKEYSGR